MFALALQGPQPRCNPVIRGFSFSPPWEVGLCEDVTWGLALGDLTWHENVSQRSFGASEEYNRLEQHFPKCVSQYSNKMPSERRGPWSTEFRGHCMYYSRPREVL